jgi:hypothetical protein
LPNAQTVKGAIRKCCMARGWSTATRCTRPLAKAPWLLDGRGRDTIDLEEQTATSE